MLRRIALATTQVLFGMLVLAVGMWALDLIPTHAEYCEYNPYRDQEKCATYHVAVVAIRYIGSFLDATAPAITAIATGVIGVFTLTIWLVSRSQLSHAHQVERAYISGGGVPASRIIQIASFNYGDSPARPPVQSSVLTGEFELHINNHGKTPGELTHIAIGFCDADNVPPAPIYNREPFHDWIGPGTQSRPMRWIEIPKDKPASAVFGRLYYRDIFGNEHSSGFIQSLPDEGGSLPLFAPPAYTAFN